MKNIKKLVAILLVLIMAFTLIACNKSDQPGTSTSNSPAGGGSSPAGGDSSPAGGGAAEKPWVSYTVSSAGMPLGRFLDGIAPFANMSACSGVYDTIISINPATRKYESKVLTNWYWEDDVTMVMEMRDDVYFSNGDHATAEDVYFSYWSHKDRGSSWLQNHGIIWDESGPRDEYTVAFKVEKHFPGFEQRGIYLIDKSWAESLAGGWDDMAWFNPVGSGPYYVYEYVNDSHIILRSRGDENYWYKDAGSIYVDEWIIRYVPDATSVYMSLQTGETDYADIAAVDYGRYVQQGGSNDYVVNVSQMGSVSFFMFSFNDTDIWYDKNLREAVALGVNWDEVGSLAMGATYIPALSVASTRFADYIELGRHEYNVEKARDIMTSLGYGPSNPLHVHTVSMSNDFYRNAFEAIQFYMSEFYIDADIVFADDPVAVGAWTTLDDSYENRTDFGLWYAFGGSPIGDFFTTINEAGVVEGGGGLTFADIPFDPFLEQWDILVGSPDAAARAQAARTMQQMIFDEYYYIPIAEWATCYGFRTGSFTEEQVVACRVTGSCFLVGTLGMSKMWN